MEAVNYAGIIARLLGPLLVFLGGGLLLNLAVVALIRRRARQGAENA